MLRWITLLVAAGLCVPAAAQDLVGEIFLVNETEESTQAAANVATDGEVFLVAWRDDSVVPSRAMARLVPADGVLVEPEREVLTGVVFASDGVNLASGSAGFLLAARIESGSDESIALRFMDSNGVPAVSEVRLLPLSGSVRGPRVTATSTGFAVVWGEAGTGEVRALLTDPFGVVTTSPFLVGTNDSIREVEVVTPEEDRVVFLWEGSTSDLPGVRARTLQGGFLDGSEEGVLVDGLSGASALAATPGPAGQVCVAYSRPTQPFFEAAAYQALDPDLVPLHGLEAVGPQEVIGTLRPAVVAGPSRCFFAWRNLGGSLVMPRISGQLDRTATVTTLHSVSRRGVASMPNGLALVVGVEGDSAQFGVGARFVQLPLFADDFEPEDFIEWSATLGASRCTNSC